MSGKKNKKPFDKEEDDIGFRDPQHRGKNIGINPEEEIDSPISLKDENDDGEKDDGEEDSFDDEEHGWHTFDMDNPDEGL